MKSVTWLRRKRVIDIDPFGRWRDVKSLDMGDESRRNDDRLVQIV